MNIENKNELICKFMGYQCTGKNHYIVNVGIDTEVRNELLPTQYMKFDKSWDWLMPVVMKINNTIGVKTIDECTDKEWVVCTMITRLYLGTPIEYVYGACVKFIEWYNSEGNEKHI